MHLLCLGEGDWPKKPSRGLSVRVLPMRQRLGRLSTLASSAAGRARGGRGGRGSAGTGRRRPLGRRAHARHARQPARAAGGASTAAEAALSLHHRPLRPAARLRIACAGPHVPGARPGHGPSRGQDHLRVRRASQAARGAWLSARTHRDDPVGYRGSRRRRECGRGGAWPRRRWPPRGASAGRDGGRASGTVARLVPVKDIDLLLEVADRLRRTFPGVECVIVGDGPERARLEAATRDLGLGGVVRFTGRVEASARFWPTWTSTWSPRSSRAECRCRCSRRWPPVCRW